MTLTSKLCVLNILNGKENKRFFANLGGEI